MRIIGGAGKSRRLMAPRGRDTRPTTDRVREALFNILTPRLSGSRFLDLYAGSGAVGLEALSRGAAGAVFVESSRPATAMIRRNIEALGFTNRAVVFQMNAHAFLNRRTHAGPFEIIFLDPPYASGDAERILRAVGGSGLLSDDGVVVAESARTAPPPESVGPLHLITRRLYGDTTLSFYELHYRNKHGTKEA